MRSASFSASCLLLTYGRPKRPARKTCVSSAVAPRGAGPIAATDEVQHGALDAGAQRLLEHDARAVDVDAEERVGAAAQRREPGDVEHARDPAQRAADRRAVQDVRADLLDIEAVELLDARPGADGHAHAVAALDERAA